MNASETLLTQPAAQAIGWALVQFVWQGALIGLVTACALAAMRRSAADVRYVVATIGLALMLTVPAVSAVQAWRGARAAATPAVPHETADVPSASIAGPRQAPPLEEGAGSSQRERTASSPVTVPTPAPPQQPWMRAVLIVWLAGVGLLTLRLLSGWWWIRRTRTRGTRPAPAYLLEIAGRLQRQLHIRRPVQYLESLVVQVPTVIGLLAPVVLMPAAALTALTPQQIEAIIAHELAHIRRHDYLVNLLQTLVETLLFYHPAVWWLSRRIRTEREHCCDDLAISLCGDPVMYARALADLEELRGGAGLALAASGGPLLQRVRRIVGAPTHAGRGPGWLAASVAIVLLGGITAGALGSAQGGSAEQATVVAAAKNVAAPVQAPARATAVAKPADARSVQAQPAEVQTVDAIEAKPIESKPIEARAAEAVSRAAALATAAETLVREPVPALVAGSLSRARSAAAVAPAVEGVHERAAPVSEQAVAAAAVVAAPVVAAPQTRSRRSGNFSWSDGTNRLEVKYDGDFEFTDDDRDVKSLSPGGYLHIREKGPAGSHSLEISADSSGALHRRYRVGNTERPFEPDGRIWLADALPRFIRQTGLGAPARVARILRTGGVDGVLAEISRIEGSWGRRLYYTELLRAEGLGDDALASILTRAGRDIASDFELASLLIDAGERVLPRDAARRAWFEAARSIGSSFETRRVLSSALTKGGATPDVLAGVLEGASRIESDFEAAELLIQAARRPLDDRTRPLFFKAADSVGSAFERRRVLSALLGDAGASEATIVAALESAAGIGSDFEKASLLTAVAQRHSLENAGRAPFFRAADTIRSPFERGRVLKAAVARTDASPDTILGALRSVGSMSSDFEASQVLLAIASRHPLQGEARDLYISAAERLGSHEQGQAMAALVRNERIGR